MSINNNILLESGTGEVEIIEFEVNNKSYCINVLKTKEIITLETITSIPNSHDSIAGMGLFRESIIPVIDLSHVLDNKKIENPTNSMALLCEFNKLTVVFLVDRVLGIRRVKWDDIAAPNDLFKNSLSIGNIVINKKIITLLDFEKIVIDISSNDNFYTESSRDIRLDDKRKKINLMLVDDSKIIREMLHDVLEQAGYTNLMFFNDGMEAYNFLLALKGEEGNNFSNRINALITDIEMPKMDGHTLTRKLKEDNILKSLPIIIFSSLITDDLYYKGKSVGADDQVSKPSLDKLVSIIDKYVL